MNNIDKRSGEQQLQVMRPYGLGESPLARFTGVEAADGTYTGEAADGTLLEYWHLLLRSKGTVIVFAFLGALAGLLLSLPQTPIYESRASLEIESFNENFMNLGELSPTSTGRGYSSAEVDISTQVKILQSRSLIEKVVERLKLDELPQLQYKPGRVSSWRKALGLPAPAPTPPRERALNIAAANFAVEPTSNTRIVEIVSEWSDPNLAADFANTLAEEFIEQSLLARWNATQRTGDWLGRQLEDLRIKLEKSEEKLQQYARASGLLYTSDTNNVAEEKLRQLQEELSRATAERITKQSQFELATTSPPDSLPEILDNGPLREYQMNLTDLRRQLAELSSSYTKSHYKVKRVEAQIRELQEVMRNERSNIIERIRNEYGAALRREKLLAADYAKQSNLVSDQANRSIQYNILMRERDTNRQLYENLLQKVKEAGVASAMSASNFRIIDRATPATFPHKPKHTLNALLGLVFGTFLGVVFVFVRERTDRTLKQPGETPHYLHVPELGVIPIADVNTLQSKRKRRLSGPSRAATATGGRGESLQLKRRGKVSEAESVEKIVWQHKLSLVAECYRATLASILFAGNGNGGPPQVLVITSPSPGAGKTTLVSNLAISLAEINKRVLVIDADMRKPRLHKVFGLPNAVGLTTLLRQREPIDNCPLETIARETNIPGLYLLPSGPGTHSISNLLHSARAVELLRRIRKEFDSVLIDTPPMMQFADARVLGRSSDGVILVLHSGGTTCDTAKAARERFVEDGTHVLGTVLSCWDPKISGYGYYESYDLNRYYGERNDVQEESIRA